MHGHPLVTVSGYKVYAYQLAKTMKCRTDQTHRLEKYCYVVIYTRRWHLEHKRNTVFYMWVFYTTCTSYDILHDIGHFSILQNYRCVV